MIDSIPASHGSIPPTDRTILSINAGVSVTGLSVQEVYACGWKFTMHPDDLPGELEMVDASGFQ